MRHARSLVIIVMATVIAGTLVPASALVWALVGPRPGTRHTPAPATVNQAPKGLARLSSSGPAESLTDGIATFRGRPTDARRQSLVDLGLRVQMMQHLPLALVRGTRAQLEAAVRSGAAFDVYPNEQLRYFSGQSRRSIDADRPRAEGIDGRGVGVAIVDSGIDATHPDLVERVTHNVKIVSPEYAGLPAHSLAGPIMVPVDAGPYNNSDLSTGHGTHVAGIVAADGHTSPEQVGVAPGADLIGYGAGDTLFIFSAVAAFDDILEHHRQWGIRVVNNSWGSSYAIFDPEHPINVATRALSEAGIVVVFSAGNEGNEMTLNSYSAAPWVISVGSGTLSKELSDFSSEGIEFDNSELRRLTVDRNRHLHFEGDRIGLYHPDVSAPGSEITSSGTPTGVVTGPTLPGGTATLSGTSMSSPHVAGLAALLLQARPSLTPDQVRQVLQVTATPMNDGAVFWQAGYGFVDAAAAIDLVRRPDFGSALLARLQEAADARVLGDRSFSVRSSDVWTFPASPVSVRGVPDLKAFDIEVTPPTGAIKALVSYPSLGLVGANPFNWEVALKDAAGKVIARSTPAETSGTSTLSVDLVNPTTDSDGKVVPPPEVAFGKWTLEVAGILQVSDNEDFLVAALGNTITVIASQLVPMPRVVPPTPQFVPADPLTLFLQPEGSGGLLPTPEGCTLEESAPRGGLALGPATGQCHAGVVGSATTNAADLPAEFTSAPFPEPVTFGGIGVLALYLADTAQPLYSPAAKSSISYTLSAVDAAGAVTRLAEGTANPEVQAGPTPTRGEYLFETRPVDVPAGSRLQLQLRFSGLYTSTMRLVYGGPYADSGMALVTGTYR